MNTIIAAIDSTAAARPVLETAVRMSELTRADVEAIHVGEGPNEMLEYITRRCGVSLRVLAGQVETELLHAIGAPEVIMAVLGARATTAGRRPVGRTALQVLRFAEKPVVIVPPEALSPPPLRRLLVPLEDTARSSQAILEGLCPLVNSDVDLVVLHVFTDATLPRMLNHSERDIETLGSEFIARNLPNAKSIEMRTGSVSARVIEVTEELGADLVFLSWSQANTSGRATVVQEVLGASGVPVVLVPLAPTRAQDCEHVGTRNETDL